MLIEEDILVFIFRHVSGIQLLLPRWHEFGTRTKTGRSASFMAQDKRKDPKQEEEGMKCFHPSSKLLEDLKKNHQGGVYVSEIVPLDTISTVSLP